MYPYSFCFLLSIYYNLVMNFSVIKDLESKYDLRGAGRRNICIASGKDCKVLDNGGKTYTDLTAGQGENCLGYADSRLVSAVSAQAEALISSPNKYYNNLNGVILNALIAGTGFNRAALTNSGVEANLLMLSLINNYVNEKAPSRRRVIVAARGKIPAGAALTKYALNVNFAFQRIELNDFAALKAALGEDAAALIFEPVSDSYMAGAEYDYLVNAYALCKSTDTLLVCDETLSGPGRTGLRYAYETYGIEPDILTLGRGLGGGIRAGALLARGTIAECFCRQGNGLDEGGNSLMACSAVKTVLDSLDSAGLREIADKGAYLYSQLCRLTKYNFVLDVRGKGLYAAIELTGRISAARIAGQMEKAGFLVDVSETNIIKITPPFIITKAEIDEACDALAAVFAGINV